MSGFFRSRWVDPPDGVVELDPSQLSPGFRAAGVACGIKPSGALDLGLVICDSEQVRSAALFTRNAAAAAPVRLCRERCDLGGLRAVAVNSGIANAGTGGRGRDDAAWMQGAAAAALGLDERTVAVASTGVVGAPLPTTEVGRGVAAAARALDPAGADDFARAIMTSDSGPKRCSLKLGGVTVSAQAKGAGMIEPDMATMLCFVQTDAVVDDPATALSAAVDGSFNLITVDGQMSTNDSVILQATGSAGEPLPDGLLDAVLLQLALDVVADGEGATRVARVVVNAAADPGEADRVARAVANSPLVKTALYGRDPNWGRVVQAAGMALAGEQVDLGPDDVNVFELASDAAEVEVSVTLGRGEAAAHRYCSDLTTDYVTFNAEYTT